MHATDEGRLNLSARGDESLNIAEIASYICYDDSLPLWIDQAMSELYHSAFCVLAYFRVYQSHENIKALAIHTSDSAPRHMLLYRINGREVTVLNEVFDIEQFYVEYFVQILFQKHPEIHCINFNRSKWTNENFSLPSRTWQKSQDTVIQLPATLAEYRSRLGKHTKRNLSNYLNRLTRLYSDFTFETTARGEADPAVISRIIEMNRLRMESKKITSGFDADLENRVIHFSRTYGCTGTVRVGGKVVAGTLYYEVGNHCYLEALSHDPAYDQDRLGQVCLYLTVKHAIEQGRAAFHLLWGEYDYKYRFLGVKEDLHFVSVYRSRLHKLLSLPELLKFRLSLFRRQVPYWWRKHVLSRLSPRPA